MTRPTRSSLIAAAVALALIAAVALSSWLYEDGANSNRYQFDRAYIRAPRETADAIRKVVASWHSGALIAAHWDEFMGMGDRVLNVFPQDDPRWRMALEPHGFLARDHMVLPESTPNKELRSHIGMWLSCSPTVVASGVRLDGNIVDAYLWSREPRKKAQLFPFERDAGSLCAALARWLRVTAPSLAKHTMRFHVDGLLFESTTNNQLTGPLPSAIPSPPPALQQFTQAAIGPKRKTAKPKYLIPHGNADGAGRVAVAGLLPVEKLLFLPQREAISKRLALAGSGTLADNWASCYLTQDDRAIELRLRATLEGIPSIATVRSVKFETSEKGSALWQARFQDTVLVGYNVAFAVVTLDLATGATYDLGTHQLIETLLKAAWPKRLHHYSGVVTGGGRVVEAHGYGVIVETSEASVLSRTRSLWLEAKNEPGQ